MFSVIVDEVFEPQKVFPLSSITMRPFGTEKPRPMPTRDDPLRRPSTFSYSLDMSPGASSIRLTPSGRLHPALHDGGGDFPDEILDAFARSEAEGLFELAARRGSDPLSPELAYWRDFSSRLLALRCRSPAGQVPLEPLAPLDDESAFALVLEAPPLEGAEYLDAAVLRRLWTELDEWLRAEAGAVGGLEAFWPLGRRPGARCLM